MFENLVNQDAAKLIISDITRESFPGSVLFSGNEASGKLTAALEVARVYSCQGNPKGKWTCECPSCLQHKSLVCSNLILMGPRDCSLEISASKNTFVTAVKNNSSFLNATRYLFLRSIRKLTLRFSSILMKGEKDISKVGSLLEEINNNLELLDFPRPLPEFTELSDICDELETKSLKLEKEFLYDSIPINQIRNMEDWARIKAASGKKTIIIENADRMNNSVRNALLKILEEPPADVNFILITSKRNSILPTILSRVRNYDFKERSVNQQREVIQRVYHNEDFSGLISDYLLTYLPVPANKIKEYAKEFYSNLVKGSIPDLKEIQKNCNDFEPRIELKIFLNEISQLQKPLIKSAIGCEASAATMVALRNCWDNITVYNQTVTGAFEVLVRELNKINITHGRILCEGM